MNYKVSNKMIEKIMDVLIQLIKIIAAPSEGERNQNRKPDVTFTGHSHIDLSTGELGFGLSATEIKRVDSKWPVTGRFKQW